MISIAERFPDLVAQWIRVVTREGGAITVIADKVPVLSESRFRDRQMIVAENQSRSIAEREAREALGYGEVDGEHADAFATDVLETPGEGDCNHGLAPRKAA